MRFKFNRKINVALMLLVAIMMVACFMLSACRDSVDGTPGEEVCTNHNFVRKDADTNKAPTYAESGRELKECTICGLTANFVIPKLERLAVTEDPQYLPLLSSYTVSYGDTLEEVKNAFFTAGWNFALDGNTTVGNVSADGYDFSVIYTPSTDAYNSLTATVRLIVQKATLMASDLKIVNPLTIPTTAETLDDVSLVLEPSQTIKGTIAWEEGQEIMRNQSATYYFIFTPSDLDSYNVYRGGIILIAD